MTDLAKLKADYAAGKLSKDKYQAAVAKVADERSAQRGVEQAAPSNGTAVRPTTVRAKARAKKS